MRPITKLEEIRNIARGQSQHVSDHGRLISIARLATELIDAERRPRLPLRPAIDGDTFEPALDEVRLVGQFALIWDVFERARRGLVRSEWVTLGEIRNIVSAYHRVTISEASISARLRDFRKARYGGHHIERRRRGNPKAGLHEYRLVPHPKTRMRWEISPEVTPGTETTDNRSASAG